MDLSATQEIIKETASLLEVLTLVKVINKKLDYILEDLEEDGMEEEVESEEEEDFPKRKLQKKN